MILLAAVLAARLRAAAPPSPLVPGRSAAEEAADAREGLRDRASRAACFAWRDATASRGSEGRRPRRPAALWEFDAATGRKTALLDAPAVEGPRRKGEAKLSLRGAAWSPTGALSSSPRPRPLALTPGGEAAARRLTNDADDEESRPSRPTGRASRTSRRTTSGSSTSRRAGRRASRRRAATHVLNGKLDWVYEEELANRAERPFVRVVARLDGDRLPPARRDPRPEYPIVDYTPTNGKVSRSATRRRATRTPIPSVHVVGPRRATRRRRSRRAGRRLRRAGALLDARREAVCFLMLDRPRRRLDVFLLPRAGGAPKLLLSESDPAWINSIEPPAFPEGRLVRLPLRAERLPPPLPVRRGRDAEERRHEGRLDDRRPVERRREDGRPSTFRRRRRTPASATSTREARRLGPARVTAEPGAHAPVSLAGRRALRRHASRARHAARRPSSGAPRAPSPRRSTTSPHPLADYDLGTVELGSFRGADGTLFYTSLVKPADFDPAKKYPVVVYVYGGPHAQVVRNAWARPAPRRLLASKGFLVWSMDNRGSWGRGHAFETPILKNLGAQELEGPARGDRRAEEAAVRRRRAGSASRAGRTAAT